MTEEITITLGKDFASLFPEILGIYRYIPVEYDSRIHVLYGEYLKL